MTIGYPPITCDQCGKPIEGTPERMVNNFLRLAPGTAATPGNPPMGQQKDAVLGRELDFHDFDCLLKWIEANTFEHD